MSIAQLEKYITLVALIFFSGNPIDLLLFGGGGDQTINYANSSSLGPLMILGFGAASVVLLLLRQLWRELIGKNQFSTFAFVLIWSTVAFAALSTLWSADPSITLRRSLTLAATTSFATYFSLRFSYQAQIRLLATALLTVTFTSLLFGFLLPQYGQMQVFPHIGAWRGVFTHKNALGGQMSMTAAFFLLHFKAKVFPRQWLCLLGLGGSLFLIVMSRSSGALLNFLLVAIAIAICRIAILKSRTIPALLLLITSWILGCAIAFSIHVEAVLNLFGKDASLTGRDQLWLSVFHAIQQRPWLGYGYESFWRGLHSPAFGIWKQVGWKPPHAHNGPLDLLLAFGLLGSILIFISFIINIIKSLFLVRLNCTPEACWPLIFMLSFSLKNMTESALIGNHISWIIYIWIGLTPYIHRLKFIEQDSVRPSYSSRGDPQSLGLIT